MEPEELAGALARAKDTTAGKDTKEKAKVMRKVLEDIAGEQHYSLTLRK
jgi:hypothetical protein